MLYSIEKYLPVVQFEAVQMWVVMEVSAGLFADWEHCCFVLTASCLVLSVTPALLDELVVSDAEHFPLLLCDLHGTPTQYPCHNIILFIIQGMSVK